MPTTTIFEVIRYTRMYICIYIQPTAFQVKVLGLLLSVCTEWTSSDDTPGSNAPTGLARESTGLARKRTENPMLRQSAFFTLNLNFQKVGLHTDSTFMDESTHVLSYNIFQGTRESRVVGSIVFQAACHQAFVSGP